MGPMMRANLWLVQPFYLRHRSGPREVDAKKVMLLTGNSKYAAGGLHRGVATVAAAMGLPDPVVARRHGGGTAWSLHPELEAAWDEAERWLEGSWPTPTWKPPPPADRRRSEMETEKQMRDAEVPWPKTTEELTAYIDGLVNREHDYGTCVYAMSMASVAAFRYVAHKLGVTGFQSSCADLDVIRRLRDLKHGFTLVDAGKLLYPQYTPLADARKYLTGRLDEMKDAARANLAKETPVHPEVKEWWERVAAGTAVVR